MNFKSSNPIIRLASYTCELNVNKVADNGCTLFWQCLFGMFISFAIILVGAFMLLLLVVDPWITFFLTDLPWWTHSFAGGDNMIVPRIISIVICCVLIWCMLFVAYVKIREKLPQSTRNKIDAGVYKMCESSSNATEFVHSKFERFCFKVNIIQDNND